MSTQLDCWKETFYSFVYYRKLSVELTCYGFLAGVVLETNVKKLEV